MALGSISQDDFGAGIYRGREASANAVYDLVNGLLDDEGQAFRRGGSAYKSGSNAGGTLTGLVDAQLVSGQRTVFWRSGQLHVLGADDSTVVNVSADEPEAGLPALHNGVLYYLISQVTTPPSHALHAYAGSRKATYSTGTVSATLGSRTLLGTGTSWLANVDAGMFLSAGLAPNDAYGIVASVESDTSLTLVNPAGNSTGGAVAYTLDPDTFVANISDPLPGVTPHIASAGGRLLIGWGQKVIFSDGLDVEGFPSFADQATNYHDMPAGSVTGALGLGASALIYTSAGVWSIENLYVAAVDDFGNIAHIIRRAYEIVLWGDVGLAQWREAPIVPAVDDVWLLPPGGAPAAISGGIKPLYLDYVKSGYQPGIASVHRSHYFLPILNGSTVVDVLVCRLDREGAPWTRWAGHAAGMAYAQRIGLSTRSPKLLALQGQRVLDLTDTFGPAGANALDADGTTSNLVLETRDYPTGQQPGFFKTARIRYELEDDGSGGTAAPTVAVAFTSDADAGSFTTITERGEQGGATGWGVSDGSKYQWALVAKKRERGRYRITVSGACARFVLRGITSLIRQSGKQ